MSLSLRTAGAVALAAMALVASVEACAAPDPTDITEVDAPPFDQFAGTNVTPGSQAGVSAVLEKRCGMLDCHGQVGRPLRIYGEFGLRFVEDDASNQPGLGATTNTELEANYQSVIGLQPEIMTEVVDQDLPPEALLLLRKPLQLERHKGGAVIFENDDAYNCITSWLASGGDAGTTDYGACFDASQL
jgi:hypothetical protein